nr:26S proteasome non-ATPase regulatory subunit 1 homolog A [Tanacetum cinerariifolium]GEZ91828.1 26S proteasome non-ATPase regulatory subunit 1 homolog A [Tanacetum cinerariifolium]
ATNWAKFSATTGLGIIHRGHLEQRRSLMPPPYFIQPTKVTDGLNAGSTNVTAGNLNDGGVANDKYVNKASFESGYTPREDHFEPNVENRRPIITDPSDVQKGPELISYANNLSP